VCVAQLQDDEASEGRVGRSQHEACRNDAAQKRYGCNQQDRKRTKHCAAFALHVIHAHILISLDASSHVTSALSPALTYMARRMGAAGADRLGAFPHALVALFLMQAEPGDVMQVKRRRVSQSRERLPSSIREGRDCGPKRAIPLIQACGRAWKLP